MRTFISTDDITFMFPGVESGLVGSLSVPSIDSILEFAAYVQEERAAIARGPQVVQCGTVSPLLLLNGSLIRIDYDATLPHGAIHYHDDALGGKGWKIVLREGGDSTLAESPDGAGGVGAGGGDEGR